MKEKYTEIKELTEEEKHKLIREIVIERLKKMPNNFRISIG